MWVDLPSIVGHYLVFHHSVLLLTVPGTEESESLADKDTQWGNKKVVERT
jgi:hypothetical protein